jgi:non-ribosomal peptide synthetase component E (peptide arylation enzyme)
VRAQTIALTPNVSNWSGPGASCVVQKTHTGQATSFVAITDTHARVSEAALIRLDDNGHVAYQIALVASSPVSKKELETLLALEGIELSIDRLVMVKAIPHSAVGRIDRDALRKDVSA